MSAQRSEKNIVQLLCASAVHSNKADWAHTVMILVHGSLMNPVKCCCRRRRCCRAHAKKLSNLLISDVIEGISYGSNSSF